MQEIRAGIVLLVGFARADVIRVGRAVEFDELVCKRLLLALDGITLVIQGVLLLAQELGGSLGVVKGTDCILQGRSGALINLFVVRLAGIHIGRRDIEGQSTGREAERIEVGVRVVEGLLDGLKTLGFKVHTERACV